MSRILHKKCCAGCGSPLGCGTAQTDCTGQKVLVAEMNASGSVSGSSTFNGSVPLAEHGSGDSSDVSITDSLDASFTLTNKFLEQLYGGGVLLAIGADGGLNTSSGTLLGYVYDTIAPFGSVSGSGSSSATIDGSATGSIFQGESASVGVSLVVNQATLVVESTITFTYSRTYWNGEDEDVSDSRPLTWHSVATVAINLTGTTTKEAVCRGDAITAETITSFTASAYVSPDYDPIGGDIEGTGDGDGSITARNRPDITPDEAPILGNKCARAISVSASLGEAITYDGPVGDDTPTFHYATFTGRGTMGAVERCGGYFPAYGGPGVYTHSYPETREVAAQFTAGMDQQHAGPNSVIGILSINQRAIGFSTSRDGSGQIHSTVTKPGSTAQDFSFDWGLSADGVRAAFEALANMAGSIIRVYRDDDTFTDQYVYTVTIAGPATITGFAFTGTVGSPAPHSSGSEVATVINARGYTTPAQCIEGGATPIALPTSGSFLFKYPSDSITFTASARQDGDPIYYCDCGTNCTSAPSSMALALTSPAVGANSAISESLIIAKPAGETGTPCHYAADWTTTSISVGNVYSSSIIVDTAGRYQLTIYDDEGSLIATFYATCEGGKTLPGVTWKLASVAGIFAPYAATLKAATS